MTPIKLSVTLATRNEEQNLARCLDSVKSIADEIIIFDEQSTDKTKEIAKKYGAQVFETPHNNNFHITKVKANAKAKGKWILQLDADEVISKELARQVKDIVQSDESELKEYIEKLEKRNPKKTSLFQRHQSAIESRDSIQHKKGEIAGFYLPRLNMFLGKPLTHAGVYPDGVIRLFKNGKGELPADNVHEQMKIHGEVCWLYGDLLHYDSPTFTRYLTRANRYTDLTAEQFKSKKVSLSLGTLFYFSFGKPFLVFINLYFRHLGILDGMRGFVWSLFSALHFPIAYFKYYSNHYNKHHGAH
jgi:glycosyltransferase involved in cell wall biosynthesis